MKLLSYSDDANGATGFSRQSRNILTKFHQQGFKIAQIGINKADDSPLRPFDDDRVPFKVFRANIEKTPGDEEGRNLLMKVFDKLQPDVLFVMGDIWFFRGWFAQWLEKQQFRHRFKTIGYYSCGFPVNQEDLEVLSLTDYPICHSRWGLGFQNNAGYDLIKQSIKNLIYIPDTVDSSVFTWVSEDQRMTDRASLGISPEHYVIGCVNRNSVRKDLGSLIESFKRIKKEVPEARLYLHTSPVDTYISNHEPIDLIKKCESVGLKGGVNFECDVVFPANFTPHFGYPDDLLKRIYGCMDLFVSTSVSEGFGVTPVEALFCGKPVIIPGHTGFSNICEKTGINPVRFYSYRDERVSTSDIYKTDQDDLVNKIMNAYDARNQSSFRSQVMYQSKKAVDEFSLNTVFEKHWMPVVSSLKEKREPKKAILYVQRGSAGDVLLSSSVFMGLRQRHPGLPIHYMTKPIYQNIVEGLVEEVVDWRPSEIHDYLYTYLPHEFKVWPGNWGSGDTPLTRIYSEILGVGFSRPQIIPDESVKLPDQYIVVHTCGGHHYRDYYNFHLALKGCHLPVIQIGGPKDQVLGNGNFKFVDLRGKLSYRQTAWVIKNAKLFVGVDSFPMHVAGVFDVPMVITFGCGAARVTGALTEGPYKFLEPVYSKVCPIVGPCYGNLKDCPRPCGPRHSPDLVRMAIKQLVPDLFHEKKVLNVSKRLMELLDRPSRRQSEATA